MLNKHLLVDNITISKITPILKIRLYEKRLGENGELVWKHSSIHMHLQAVCVLLLWNFPHFPIFNVIKQKSNFMCLINRNEFHCIMSCLGGLDIHG